MFDFDALTIVQLYEYQWNIEVLFRRLKQNFQLVYFYSDSTEGIKTQVWMICSF
ncbi:MAG: transposase [Cytophagales bacterium]|nr:transposase [Cytophagales bacterium]